MTDREAIELLKYPIHKWSMDWDDREDGLSYIEAIEQAITALQERIDREKGCGFCKEDSEGYTTMHGAYYLHKNELCTGHCKPREINYCPMCGHKLKTAMPGEEVCYQSN